MVDVKKVTGVLSKSSLKVSQNANTDYLVNFNPNDPLDLSVLSIDPFSIFIQESNRLVVKIPFSRFYKVKLVIAPTSVSLPTTYTDFNPFAQNKAVIAYTERPRIQIYRNGAFYNDITKGIYTNPGGALISSQWRSANAYDAYKLYTPATVEGIVELLAGDELIFRSDFDIGRRTYPQRITLSLTNGWYIPREYVGVTGETFLTRDVCSVTTQFFFEISEITEL